VPRELAIEPIMLGFSFAEATDAGVIIGDIFAITDGAIPEEFTPIPLERNALAATSDAVATVCVLDAPANKEPIPPRTEDPVLNSGLCENSAIHPLSSLLL